MPLRNAPSAQCPRADRLNKIRRCRAEQNRRAKNAVPADAALGLECAGYRLLSVMGAVLLPDWRIVLTGPALAGLATAAPEGS
jgi:hypothetical protein